MWRFCSLVEVWLFRATDEKEHAALTRALESDVHFTWARSSGSGKSGMLADPIRWQKNEPGESLLSAHRNRATKGE